MNYSFSVEMFHGISDPEVLEIFGRLNTYSVPLNAQELRNGRYFGLFKQSAYSLSHEHLEFWRRHEIFTERAIARMLEVELTSELLIAQLAGMQDKKKSIDQFYDRYDGEFRERKDMETRFRGVLDMINETFSDTLSDTAFCRSPLFYTLFCAIYHRQYQLPNADPRSPRRQLTTSERIGLSQVVSELSDAVDAGRSKQATPHRYASFITAALTQTDNIKPRQARFKQLYELAFEGS